VITHCPRSSKSWIGVLALFSGKFLAVEIARVVGIRPLSDMVWEVMASGWLRCMKEPGIGSPVLDC
jgi:hypothetical protein